MSGKYYDTKFEKYEGAKRFDVTHPAHYGSVTVAAPDKEAAIVAAANFWGERWQDYNFYAWCEVRAV